MAESDFINYGQLGEFADKLPLQHWIFPGSSAGGQVTHQAMLQAAVDSSDATSCVLTVGIDMRRESWLQSFGFLREVQNTIH